MLSHIRYLCPLSFCTRMKRLTKHASDSHTVQRYLPLLCRRLLSHDPLIPFSLHAIGTYLLRLALFPPLAVHIHLILWLENRSDLAEQVPHFFRVIFTSFPCTIAVVEEVFYSCLPFFLFLPSYKPTRLTHPFLAPRPLPYCSGPGRNPHSPCLSQPPPPLYSIPARRTEDVEEEKEKKKELRLSAGDCCRLPLSSDHVHPPSTRSCFHKPNEWDLL